MAEQYQKVLQLYRSTNIWDTKNMAKAEVEIHAKNLHPEIAELTINQYLRDGEPIISKYYDKADGYTFGYNTTPINNPYDTTASSATHIWLDGFDSFTTDEFKIVGGVAKIKGKVPDYDSAAYIRVTEPDGTNTKYYKLEITEAPQPTPTRSKSAVFGVALVDSSNYYIEWFDSAAEAKGAISELNYSDNDLTNGFVALTNQKDGKIEAIHGQISRPNTNAISIDQDANYTYVKLTDGSSIPANYVWTSTNTGNTKPAAIAPGNITNETPKYFHVTDASTEADNGYYELRKNIAIALNIDPNDPDVLSQTAAGLKTNLDVRKLTQEEVNAHGSNVREGYRLIGNYNNADRAIGQDILIYKDSTLYKVWLGDYGDTMENMYAWVDENDNVLYTEKGIKEDEHPLADDKTYTYIDNNEYAKGEYEVTDYDEEHKTITVNGVKYLYNGSAYPWITPNQTQTHESLNFIYYKADDTYELVKVDIESFLQESEFGNGLAVDTVNHVVSVKLANDGGLDFGSEAGYPPTANNKSLIIKIDNTDTYYRVATTAEREAGTGLYTQTVNTSTGAVTYTAFSGTVDPDTTYYVNKTHLQTTDKGLKLDDGILRNEIADTIGDKLQVNGEKFIKDVNGNLIGKVVGEDITVAGNGSSKANVDMTEVVNIEGAPVVVSEVPTTGVTADSAALLFCITDSYLYQRKSSDDGYELFHPNLNPTPDYIEVNGLIYSKETNGYKLYYINKDTNLNDAIAILNYLTYNLDMGQFTN